jgi:hypothetical protein
MTATIHKFPRKAADAPADTFFGRGDIKLPPDVAADAVTAAAIHSAVLTVVQHGLYMDPDKEKQHAQDLAFVEEAIRALVYRHYGLEHRFHPLIEQKIKFKDGKYKG